MYDELEVHEGSVRDTSEELKKATKDSQLPASDRTPTETSCNAG
jgi:hypothetical protein